MRPSAAAKPETKPMTLIQRPSLLLACITSSHIQENTSTLGLEPMRNNLKFTLVPSNQLHQLLTEIQ